MVQRGYYPRDSAHQAGQAGSTNGTEKDFMHSRCAILTLLVAAGCARLNNRVSDSSVTTARQLALQGMEAEQQGQWEQAESLYAASLAQCPADDRARGRYAETLWRRGQQGRAIANMEEAVRLSGNDPERIVQLGRMYLERGDLRQATELAEKAIEGDRDSASAWALRGEVLRRQGILPDSLASLQRSAGLQSPTTETQLAIANIYAAQGRPQRALATLQSLADEYPSGKAPVEVYIQQGLALKALERYDAAVEQLTMAVNQGPPSADLLCHFAEAQALAGNLGNARLAASAAVEADPQHTGARELSRRLQQQGAGAIIAQGPK
jgi:tetratricopeptide (TPR) repeat protein